jgi:hypothetical protein
MVLIGNSAITPVGIILRGIGIAVGTDLVTLTGSLMLAFRREPM